MNLDIDCTIAKLPNCISFKRISVIISVLLGFFYMGASHPILLYTLPQPALHITPACPIHHPSLPYTSPQPALYITPDGPIHHPSLPRVEYLNIFQDKSIYLNRFCIGTNYSALWSYFLTDIYVNSLMAASRLWFLYWSFYEYFNVFFFTPCVSNITSWLVYW